MDVVPNSTPKASSRVEHFLRPYKETTYPFYLRHGTLERFSLHINKYTLIVAILITYGPIPDKGPLWQRPNYQGPTFRWGGCYMACQLTILILYDPRSVYLIFPFHFPFTTSQSRQHLHHTGIQENCTNYDFWISALSSHIIVNSWMD